MKLVNKLRFTIGLGIIVFLLFSYFFRIEIESGANYVITDTLLGIIIFHSFFVLVLYILIAAFFIFTGVRNIKLV